MTLSKLCEGYKADIDAAIKKYDEALGKNDAATMTTALDEAKKAASAYNDQMELDLFKSHKEDTDPIYGVLKCPFVDTLKIVEAKEDGRPIGLYAEDTEKLISLKKLYKNSLKKLDWEPKVQHFTELLTERAAQNLGIATDGIRDNFKMSAKAKAEPIMADPLSNSSLLKALQSAIDAIVFKDDGTGSNAYKANNRDLKFIRACFTTENRRERLGVSASKSERVTNLIVKALYRVLNDLAYSLDYKKLTENDVLKAQKAANKAAKEAKKAADAPAAETTASNVPKKEATKKPKSKKVAPKSVEAVILPSPAVSEGAA